MTPLGTATSTLAHVLAEGRLAAGVLGQPAPLALVVLAVLAIAIFQAGETSLLTIADARIQDMAAAAEARSRCFRRHLRLWIDKPDHVLTAIVIGRHAAHLSLILGAVVALADIADEALKPLAALVVGAMLLSMIVAVELGARAIAKEKAQLALTVTFPVIAVTYFLTLPVVLPLTRMARAVARAVGGVGSSTGPFVTERDIVELIDLGQKAGTIDKTESRMLTSVIELGDTLVREVMVPRTEISALPITATYDEVRRETTERGHTRMPVYDGTLDAVRGFFHSKDLLTLDPASFSLSAQLRPIEFVPETQRVSDLLRTFQRKKTHLAIVADEFGGTSGIVALEDILELIVGPIQDEHDDEEALIKRTGDGRFIVAGRTNLYDVGDAIGVTFPAGAYETVGGFMTATIGRIPKGADQVVWAGFGFTVQDADGRRVGKVEIVRRPPEPAALTSTKPVSVKPVAVPSTTPRPAATSPLPVSTSGPNPKATRIDSGPTRRAPRDDER